jgi:hypothetical protein
MGIYNSGNVLSGAPLITIIERGSAYQCNSFEPNYASKEIKKTDRNDLPSGLELIDDFATFSAELQFETLTSVAPLRGQTFNIRNGSEVLERKYVITTVGQPRTKGGEAVIKISGTCVTFPPPTA